MTDHSIKPLGACIAPAVIFIFTDIDGDTVKLPSGTALTGTAAEIVLSGAGLDVVSLSTSAEPAAGVDRFGIVAEQIGKAQIGVVKFKFDKGERDAADAFAATPTSPGAGVLTFDFFLREIVV